MITNSNKLEIFENFISIPKSIRKVETNSISIASGSFVNGEMSAFSDAMARDTNSLTDSIEVRAIDYFHYRHMHEHTFKSWIKLKAAEMLFPNKKITKIRYQSVDEFFNDVKDSIKTLEVNPGSVEFYTNAIETAKNNGQIAFLEILRDKKDGVLAEAKLLEVGEMKYVTEEDVVKFYKKANLKDKMLKLTWIKNYARMIPEDVIEEKKKYDVSELFDNYAVMHFDKYDNSTKMTKAEVEKAKDPILFGVLKGTRKLYFIGDWIDEYCDLTLDKFLSTLEMEEARKLSEESMKEGLNM
jgi:hypothetical protein